MKQKNHLVRVAVVAGIGIFVVFSVVLTLAIGINVALKPLADTLQDVSGLSARVSKLEAEVQSLKKKSPGAPQQPAMPSEDYSKVYDIPVGDSPVTGRPDASVTLTVFTDFQCPFCARFHPVVEQVHKAFPDDVKIVVKNFPLVFHPQAKPAAKAALAAGLQGKYDEMAALIMARNPDNVTEEDYRAFAKQKGLDPDKYVNDLKEYAKARREGRESAVKVEFPPRKPDFSDELFRQLAAEAGLDVDRFVKDLKEKDADLEKRIADDVAVARDADVRGTPTFFINGKKSRSRDLAGFTAEIRSLLKK